jgi:hypothetical protein
MRFTLTGAESGAESVSSISIHLSSMFMGAILEGKSDFGYDLGGEYNELVSANITVPNKTGELPSSQSNKCSRSTHCLL